MSQRHFNTAGPCRPEIHYMLPPERRLPEVRRLIDAEGYFVVHAPRQVGKTTALRALATALTEEGRYTSVVLSMERGAGFTDIGAAELAILDGWIDRTDVELPPELRPALWLAAAPGARIGRALKHWSMTSRRPLVVFLDEVDALRDQVLISVLRQLRDGHSSRPKGFPASLALIGMRDVRDYKVASGGSDRLGTASPFNIKVASITLRNFTADEVVELYAQHTADTGQVFTPGAMQRAFDLTQGQPWLVNALASVAVAVTPPPQPITVEEIDQARQTLIARQDTHLDSLSERLREQRVQAIIEPMLSGGTVPNVAEDDARYVEDLGLVRLTPTGGLAIANPIYAEVIPKVLARTPRRSLPDIGATWLHPDGTLDIDRLLTAFLSFWRQHGHPLMGSAPYTEVAAQLVFLAFLDRVANGGGNISREYALGTGRIDVMLEYGPPGRRAKFAFELKVHRDGRPDPMTDGLGQLDTYLARAGLETGWLIIFDQRSGLPPIEERVSVSESVTPGGRRVHVIRG